MAGVLTIAQQRRVEAIKVARNVLGSTPATLLFSTPNPVNGSIVDIVTLAEYLIGGPEALVASLPKPVVNSTTILNTESNQP